MRTSTSESTSSNLIRRFEFDGAVFEVAESLGFDEGDAEEVLDAINSMQFTDRAVRGVRILADHEKPDEPYNLSVVFDRFKKR